MPSDYNKSLIAAATPVKLYEYSLGQKFFDYRNSENLGDVFQGTVNFLFILAYTLSVIFIAVSGVKFMSSAGDKTKLETAKNSLTYSVLALILIFALTLLLNYIIDMFGGGPSYIVPFSSLFLTTP